MPHSLTKRSCPCLPPIYGLVEGYLTDFDSTRYLADSQRVFNKIRLLAVHTPQVEQVLI